MSELTVTLSSAVVVAPFGVQGPDRSNKGGSALMGAASAGDFRMVHELLDNGADLQPRLLETDESAVTLAARHGHVEIARLLSDDRLKERDALKVPTQI